MQQNVYTSVPVIRYLNMGTKVTDRLQTDRLRYAEMCRTRRNRLWSKSDIAYSYTLLHSVVCSSVDCHLPHV